MRLQNLVALERRLHVGRNATRAIVLNLSTTRGCPFQAWSVGELLRLDRSVLVPGDAKPSKKTRQRRVADAVA